MMKDAMESIYSYVVT